jgi:hypothetical protein
MVFLTIYRSMFRCLFPCAAQERLRRSQAKLDQLLGAAKRMATSVLNDGYSQETGAPSKDNQVRVEFAMNVVFFHSFILLFPTITERCEINGYVCCNCLKSYAVRIRGLNYSPFSPWPTLLNSKQQQPQPPQRNLPHTVTSADDRPLALSAQQGATSNLAGATPAAARAAAPAAATPASTSLARLARPSLRQGQATTPVRKPTYMDTDYSLSLDDDYSELAATVTGKKATTPEPQKVMFSIPKPFLPAGSVRNVRNESSR